MKEKKSKKAFRLAAVLLAVLMLAGQFTTVFAAVKAEDNGHIDYVSFGASVTNGYGLRGYLPDEVVKDPFLADKNTLNVFGYGMAPKEGYPYLVSEKLEEMGYDVDLKQYAISSMRVEELRVLLDNSYYGDEYTAWRFYDENGNGWFKQANGSLENSRKAYQDAVKNSELITIEIGVNNFGVYTFNNIIGVIRSGGESYWKDPKFTTLFSDEEQKIFNQAKSLVISELQKAGTDETMVKIAEKIANVLAYATIGYIRNFDIVIEKIYELNPDANIVVVSIQNLMEGVDMEFNGVKVPIGDVYGSVIDAANLYTQVGSPNSDRYCYAQAAKDDLATTFLDELKTYNGDPTTLSDSMKDCFDMYDDDLYLRSKLQYIIAPWMVMQQKGMNVPFDKFAAAAVKGIVNGRMDLLTAEEIGWLGMLLQILGINEKFQQVANPDEMYIQLVTSEKYQDALNTAYDVAAKIMLRVGKVDTIEVEFATFYEAYNKADDLLLNYIINSAFEGAIMTLMGQPYEFVMDESILADKNTEAAAVLLLRFMLGNSFFAHPNAQGHIEVRDAVISALENETTGKEVAIGEAEEALDYLTGILEEYGPEIAEELYNKYAESIKGEYVYSEDAYYVNIGDSISSGEKNYADKVASELELGEDRFKDYTYENFRTEDWRYVLDEKYEGDAYSKDVVKNLEALRAELTAELKKADIITVATGNLTPFVISQITKDLIGEPYEMDWAKLVGKDKVQYIEMALAEVEKYVEEADLPEIDYVNIDVKDIVMTAIESYAYAYAGFAFNYAELANVIHSINPEAEVILVGTYNALSELELEGFALGEYIEYLIKLTDIQFSAYSMITPKTAFTAVGDVAVEKTVKDMTDLILMILSGETTQISPSDAGHEHIKDAILGNLDITYSDSGKLGDVNLDGEVDAKDATQILRFVNAKTSFLDAEGADGELSRSNADVDGSKEIDAKDATQILRYCNAKTNTIER